MKKYFKHIKLTLILCISVSTLQSCLVEDDEVDFGNGPVIVQFQNLSATQNFLQTDANPAYTYEVPVGIFGGKGVALSEDVTFTVSVASESIAKEGTEISFPEGKEFTIPAGELSVPVIIKVESENLDSTDPATLVLQIDSSSETVSDNNKTSIVLQAICPSDLAGEYKYTGGTKLAATITETGSGTYEISRDNAYNSAYAIYISDVCGNLAITGSFLNGQGYPVSGTASLNPSTGVITLVVTHEGLYSNRTMTLVPQ